MAKDNIDLVCSVAELSTLFEKRSSVGDFLHSVVDLVANHMRSDVCSIYLLEPNSRTLVLRATHGLDPRSVGSVRLSIGEGITGLALKELRPIREASASKNRSFKLITGIAEEPFEAFLAVPIRRGLARIGVITLQDRRHGYFTQHDTKALRAIASQLATAIENAELLMEIHAPDEPPPAPPVAPVYTGVGASDGIAIGRSYLFRPLHHVGHGYEANPAALPRLAAAERPLALARFDGALAATERQIRELQSTTDDAISDIAGLIFSAHLLMLSDDSFSGAMRELVGQGVEPVAAVHQVVESFVRLFERNANPHLIEKTQDVRDLGHRVIRNLTCEQAGVAAGAGSGAGREVAAGTGREVAAGAGREVAAGAGREVAAGCETVEIGDYSGQVLLAGELFPSELVKVVRQHCAGIVLAGGGMTTHIAILARSFGVPLLLVQEPAVFQIPDDTEVILDATGGVLFVAPGGDTTEEYHQRVLVTTAAPAPPVDDTGPAVAPVRRMADGTVVSVLANINIVHDTIEARRYGAGGIGLYRSEFPFIVRNDFPSEEEQLGIYRRIVESMPERRVVLRTLDIGGDKMPGYITESREANPFLGMRGIRFSLAQRELFVDQLRALLRAGGGREHVDIMFPMVSSLDEVLRAKELVWECVEDLEIEVEGPSFCAKPRIGAMIELPAALEVAGELADACDFLCIGTNDLVMYLLAVDRTNDRLGSLYKAHHPAVVRALKRMMDALGDRAPMVSVCGDAAADLALLPMFLGLGITTISVEPRQIPAVTQRIAATTMAGGRDLVEALVRARTIEQAERIVAEQAAPVEPGAP